MPTFLSHLLDLILPPRCAGCGRTGAVLCAACLGAMRARPFARPPAPGGPPECWAAAVYEGAARRAILAYKERGRTALRPALAACLLAAIRAAGPPAAPFLLVPVPSARGALRRRGHDPVAGLAALAARGLRGRGRAAACAPVLGHRRRVRDQAGLSAPERARNVAGAFQVAPAAAGRLRGRTAVLVDDVATTGATLAEAAAALRAAGAEVPLAVVVAAPRRHL
ncbi:hypothetical protein Skr01_15000 [Sphaerisporangium krabiense]|uniref:Putative amidophosphoribosyltransferase n=1 Tax=Sphaerisporangium krabiense TaxID=763782 RepID=A0A7W8YZY9_9ACTN|nr:phosphoribosyltransferase family protein [Sphaerisporangium krabiense]MBB5624628.1 putative amidophosphoribosyltransferase [Sphaerisporangium krabiense]GII61415.1 hypothetical protein Skr01_15000 [Sphaerisporangium krabiense]